MLRGLPLNLFLKRKLSLNETVHTSSARPPCAARVYSAYKVADLSTPSKNIFGTTWKRPTQYQTHTHTEKTTGRSLFSHSTIYMDTDKAHSKLSAERRLIFVATRSNNFTAAAQRLAAGLTSFETVVSRRRITLPHPPPHPQQPQARRVAHRRRETATSRVVACEGLTIEY